MPNYRNALWALPFLLCLLAFTACNNKTTTPPVGEVESQTPAPGFSKDQMIFTFAWMADINSGMDSTLDQLQAHAKNSVTAILANDTIQDSLGNWTLLWGPVTYTHTNTCADTCLTDNTMMLLQGTDPTNGNPLYVVAIAGTNFISIYDWEDEDFDVTGMVEWPAKPSTGNNNLSAFNNPKVVTDPDTTNQGNYISNGITTGINNLLNMMQDGSKGTLLQFLKAQVGTATGTPEIAVTGHSLGGGLSPVVALSLKDNQTYWNPNGNFTVSAYPYAGQSPGNAGFAKYFGQNISGDNFGGRYNNIDVVPHAFQTSMMQQIANLYTFAGANLQDECIINGLVNCVIKKIQDFNYTTLYSAADTFTGTISYDSAAVTSAAQAQYSGMTFKQRFQFGLEKDKQCGFSENAEDVFVRTVSFADVTLQSHVPAYPIHFQLGLLDTIMHRYYDQNAKPTNLESEFLGIPLIKSCAE